MELQSIHYARRKPFPKISLELDTTIKACGSTPLKYFLSWTACALDSAVRMTVQDSPLYAPLASQQVALRWRLRVINWHTSSGKVVTTIKLFFRFSDSMTESTNTDYPGIALLQNDSSET